MRPIDTATRRALAVKASCDPRTIDKLLRGESVRGLAGHRAEEALREAGYSLHPRQRPADKARKA